MSEKIHIFDTTLRDGEQAPGSSLEVEEKIEIAKQLSKLNVDVIEAGFPVSSKAQYQAVESIADMVKVQPLLHWPAVLRMTLKKLIKLSRVQKNIASILLLEHLTFI